ncbi:1-acyl-sn-glycerol-3-phosphate acyltransferase [Halolactibacillus halophilus]|uniref:1-acyl-sn-glycerol-3-phosphate acyltransferase n=1 Tax=Halolactibacillus halophilus TaxID=306540 RepID=A0A1I5NV06_9BACI|nr:lysophospholipid acyltransferase family protein [Halolactibacillus halophilus]GEM01459.1 hypothetical protein HHA03_09910 [Halolactibacillus halophilus]SFP25625.1 1-acyl-sn-glycerol-3-phosphate acyltransferase [Halolactibacillus halophilus]
MITAKHVSLFKSVFYRYLKYYLLKKQFGKIVVHGQLTPVEKPVLYLINHSSWWDGLILFYLVETLTKQNHYVMMDETGLKRYPFFRKCGAFSLNKSKPRSLVETFQYMDQLMTQQQPIWVFPQGKVEHQEAVPFVFEPGLGRIMTLKEHVHVVPVTLQYVFLEEQKPVVSVMIGEALITNKKDKSKREYLKQAEALMTKQYRIQKQMMIDDPHFYKAPTWQSILKSSRSTSDWLDAFKRTKR